MHIRNLKFEIEKTHANIITNHKKQKRQVINSPPDCDIGLATVSRFEDGEVNIVVYDNVRGQDVYILQIYLYPSR